jgi:hypothetical protein
MSSTLVIKGGERHRNDDNAAAAKDARRWTRIVLMATMTLSNSIQIVLSCIEIDSMLIDVPENEERGNLHLPMQHVRIDLFASDDFSKKWTNFTRAQLRQLKQLWGLGETVRVPRDGGTNHCSFNAEELMTFTLDALKTGDPKNEMSTKLIGGDDGRWGAGHNWLVGCLDNRHQHLLGPASLHFWMDNVPEFAAKMGEAARLDQPIKDTRGNATGHARGLDIHPDEFSVFALMDCNEALICRPGSGPAGDFEHAPRKEGTGDMQRAFFGGHHHDHALETLTATLPNGMQGAVFGPVSARRQAHSFVVIFVVWNMKHKLVTELVFILN